MAKTKTGATLLMRLLTIFDRLLDVFGRKRRHGQPRKPGQGDAANGKRGEAEQKDLYPLW